MKTGTKEIKIKQEKKKKTQVIGEWSFKTLSLSGQTSGGMRSNINYYPQQVRLVN